MFPADKYSRTDKLISGVRNDKKALGDDSEGGDGNIQRHHMSDGYMGIYIRKSSLSFTFEGVQFHDV